MQCIGDTIMVEKCDGGACILPHDGEFFVLLLNTHTPLATTVLRFCRFTRLQNYAEYLDVFSCLNYT